jgi:hypothetical protein
MPNRKRLNADERFKSLIDDFNCVDAMSKEFDLERTRIVKKLRNIIRLRGRGKHNGNESSINAHDVVQNRLSNEEVRKHLDAATYNRCFKKLKFIQIDGGPLLPPSKEVPDLGPPEVQEIDYEH